MDQRDDAATRHLAQQLQHTQRTIDKIHATIAKVRTLDMERRALADGRLS
jgi:hypothetical protein